MSKINYVTGDATEPQGDRYKIICHVCNDLGGWGRGFVLALSARWKSPEMNYRSWYAGKQPDLGPFALGMTQIVPVEDNVAVANMVAQHAYGADGKPPIRYDALESCFKGVAYRAAAVNASVHMPRIGVGLAGGRWDMIEPILDCTLSSQGIPVTVYDLPSGATRSQFPGLVD